MSGWKYVLFGGQMDMAMPVLFPEMFIHGEVAQRLHESNLLPLRGYISAGYVDGLTVVGTSGRSESLKIDSRPTDATIINVHPYQKGLPDIGMTRQIEIMILQKSIEMLQERIQRLSSGEA